MEAQRSTGGTATVLPRWILGFGAFAILFFMASQVTAFTISPAERDMGNLQKILYVHVPAAWISMVSYFLVFVASIGYLWRGRERLDLFAASAAEAGVVLTGLTLALGSIWGRSTWGTWWEWDPRLTSTAVLFLVFVGYLSLRGFIEDDVRRARWSAAIGILGFLNVIMVYYSVQWWRGIHQTQSSPETLSPMYTLGLRMNAFAFLFLMILFVSVRYHTAVLERGAEAREEEEALAGAAHV
jgi:heme exporter protein C